VWGVSAGSDGDMDVGGGEDAGVDENVNGYWGYDCGVDAGEWEDNGVEREPELEHDVSRSIH